MDIDENKIMKFFNRVFTHRTEKYCDTCTTRCCNDCYVHNGWFITEEITEENLLKLKEEYNFSVEKGFLGEKGCVLPRNKRSVVCLSYICGRFANNMDYRTEIKIVDFSKELLRSRQEKICKDNNKEYVYSVYSFTGFPINQRPHEKGEK